MNRLATLVMPLVIIATALPLLGADAKPPAEAMKTQLKGFSFAGTLGQAIDAIAAKSSAAIEVDWNALTAAGARADRPVTIKVAGASAAGVLDSVLAQAATKGNPLAWRIEAGAVRVSTQVRILNRSATPTATPITVDGPRPGGSNGASTRPSESVARGGLKYDFEKSSLTDVLAFFKTAAGVNMHVNWRALQEANVDKDTPVTLHVKDVPISDAMDLVFDDLNAGKDKLQSVYWVIDKGILLVSTGAALDKEMRVKVFEIADLLMPVPDFSGPTDELSGSDNSGNTTGGIAVVNPTDTDATDENSSAALRKKLEAGVIKVVRGSVSADMWEPEGKGTIQLMGNNLIISQSLLGLKLMGKAVQ